jgi:hypothetical protein
MGQNGGQFKIFGWIWKETNCRRIEMPKDRELPIPDRFLIGKVADDLQKAHVGRGGANWETLAIAAIKSVQANERCSECHEPVQLPTICGECLNKMWYTEERKVHGTLFRK